MADVLVHAWYLWFASTSVCGVNEQKHGQCHCVIATHSVVKGGAVQLSSVTEYIILYGWTNSVFIFSQVHGPMWSLSEPNLYECTGEQMIPQNATRRAGRQSACCGKNVRFVSLKADAMTKSSLDRVKPGVRVVMHTHKQTGPQDLCLYWSQ